MATTAPSPPAAGGCGLSVIADSRTNALLVQQVEVLTHERDSLKSRLSAARSRVDALLERLPELVVKPTGESGGYGIVIGPRATAAEQLRQFQIGETAFQQAYLQDQEDRAWHQAQVDQLEAEIRDYEQQRGKEGRACPLDDRDLVFLGAPRTGGLQHVGPAD